MILSLVLGIELQAKIGSEAQAAFPRECCGLIEGVYEGDIARALALHPTRNLAKEDDRFEIDPAAHISLLRSLRGTGREVIGCYHSHPSGHAEPSARDHESALGQCFLWIIVALASTNKNRKKLTIGAFELSSGSHSEVPILAAAVV